MGLHTPMAVIVTVYTLLLGLAIVSPIVSSGLDSGVISTGSPESLIDTVLGSNTLTIITNIVFVMFWTFGAPLFLNIILLVPRIAGIIALYRLFLPTTG